MLTAGILISTRNTPPSFPGIGTDQCHDRVQTVEEKMWVKLRFQGAQLRFLGKDL
jgi:hypothetical protein